MPRVLVSFFFVSIFTFALDYFSLFVFTFILDDAIHSSVRPTICYFIPTLSFCCTVLIFNNFCLKTFFPPITRIGFCLSGSEECKGYSKLGYNKLSVHLSHLRCLVIGFAFVFNVSSYEGSGTISRSLSTKSRRVYVSVALLEFTLQFSYDKLQEMLSIYESTFFTTAFLL